MKFLVIMKGVTGALMPEDVLGAFKGARRYVNGLLADGTLDCAYAFPDGNGACIVNVDSHEQLWETVEGYPFSSRVQFELYPLVDVTHYWDNVIARLEGEAGG